MTEKKMEKEKKAKEKKTAEAGKKETEVAKASWNISRCGGHIEGLAFPLDERCAKDCPSDSYKKLEKYRQENGIQQIISEKGNERSGLWAESNEKKFRVYNLGCTTCRVYEIYNSQLGFLGIFKEESGGEVTEAVKDMAMQMGVRIGDIE